MQPLARAGLDAARVTALLQADDLEVSAGCELLRPDLTVAEDISDDFAGGSHGWNLHRSIHTVCTLNLTRQLVWGVDLVRPYVDLSDGQVEARFYRGVFALTTPLSTFGEDPQTFEVQGYDRLYLLDRQVGADYTVAAGVTYRQALTDAFAAAGLTGFVIEGSAADSTLPVAKTWPLIGDNQADPDQTTTPVTWLRIVNDLLRAIRFRAVWADERGRFHCEEYRDPASRPVEFVFDADDLTSDIVGEDRTLDEDEFRTPNRWVFRWTNAPSTTVAADLTYVRTLPDEHPMSALKRGLTWTQVIDYEAASRAKLVALGDDRVASDRRRARKLALSTGPFPVAGHADVFEYRDPEVGVVKVQASSWDGSFDESDYQWEWEAVT